MDGLLKFSDYDIFGYLASGLVLLGVCDVAVGTHLVLDTTWSITHIAFILIAAYVVGHIVAATATLLLDRLFIRSVFGNPSNILMRRERGWWRRWLLSGFLEPLPENVQDSALARAGVQRGEKDAGEQVFWRAWPIIKRDALPFARMESFLRQYGFCRNLSFVSFLAAIVFYVRTPDVPDLPPRTSLPFWASLIIGVAMFHRYLKFFRAYSVEVFSTYAEPDTATAKTHGGDGGRTDSLASQPQTKTEQEAHMGNVSDEDLKKWLDAMPGRDSLPFNTSPLKLYSVASLYKGFDPDDPSTLSQALDTKIYRWTRQGDTDAPRAMDESEVVATRIHDTSIDHSIAAFLDAPHKRTIGFMGGHNAPRNSVAFRRIAGIARDLRRRNFMIVTGGGPGLMEAANFGAFMAPYSDKQFFEALSELASVPDYRAKAEWVASAAKVRRKLLDDWNAEEKPESSNLGVPTWVYGSEPPNLFATAIGKYFFNSLREDGLVTIANGGIVFGKGDAGTVQEVFQNATINYYREKDVAPTPMVFFNVDFWNPSTETDAAAGAPLDAHRKPVFPLIAKLGAQAGAPFDQVLMLSDDPDEITEFLSAMNSGTAIHERRADVSLRSMVHRERKTAIK